MTDNYQVSLIANVTSRHAEMIECELTHREDNLVEEDVETVSGSLRLTTVEDDTDGIDEEKNVDTTTAATFSVSNQLTISSEHKCVKIRSLPRFEALPCRTRACQ